MTIMPADWSDILTVLHETYEIWSAGLSKQHYFEYIWRQINHTWGRKNHTFYVMKEEERVVSSCKVYQVELSSRGQRFRFAGIGAVYTLNRYRELGYATKMLTEVIDRCKSSGLDGVLLFSDLDPFFYEKFGFIELGAADFSIYLPWHPPVQSDEAVSTYLENHHIPTIATIYNNWRRTQPFAFARGQSYFQYKAAKERFLAEKSTLSWPRLQVDLFEENGRNTAYALSERGGSVLRVLEVVGAPPGRLELWTKLLVRAQSTQIRKLRGWEAGVTDMAPGFNLENILEPATLATLNASPVSYYDRDWGRPMILPFNPTLESWINYFPCPLLELDHL